VHYSKSVFAIFPALESVPRTVVLVSLSVGVVG